jgi:hypothetical protein
MASRLWERKSAFNFVKRLYGGLGFIAKKILHAKSFGQSEASGAAKFSG